MSGRERTYRPRARTTRPLGEGRSANAPPSTPLDPPVKRDDGWFVSEPLAHRLHQKSALGRRVEGGLVLTPEEVLFCHWYRHLPLPGGDPWFELSLKQDNSLLRRTIALDGLRNGGERVVPVEHLGSRFASLPQATWAIRWERHEAWSSHPGHTQVRIQRTHDPLDWDELGQWVAGVHGFDHLAEMVVIEDDFDTTVYHLSFMEPAVITATLATSMLSNRRTWQHGASKAPPSTVAFLFLWGRIGHYRPLVYLIFRVVSFEPKSGSTSKTPPPRGKGCSLPLLWQDFCFARVSSTGAGGGLRG